MTELNGLGKLCDPDDLSLDPKEMKSAIPRYTTLTIKEKKCKWQAKAYETCCKKYGGAGSLMCTEELQRMQECINSWYRNADFKRQRIEEYLRDRSEYRRTGKRVQYGKET